MLLVGMNNAIFVHEADLRWDVPLVMLDVEVPWFGGVAGGIFDSHM